MEGEVTCSQDAILPDKARANRGNDTQTKAGGHRLALSKAVLEQTERSPAGRRLHSVIGKEQRSLQLWLS